MDVIEAINGRKSVRSFKPDPVPKDVLEAIMRAALQVPSWENTQPWEFAVVGGEAMRELKAAVMGKVRAGGKPNLDIPWPKFKGVHLERAKAEGRDVLQWVGISKGDSGARLDWQVSMTRFFHAPNAVIAYMDAYLGEWSVLDVGLAVENLMIAAWNFGVGTCALSAAVIYPDVLRGLLNIPESKRFIIGLAVGFPDLSNPGATFCVGREPLKTLVTWHGFD